MGAEQEWRETVLFLVGEHLLLSEVATRRDLDDEDLILHVAARIGDPERLAMLYLLTVADALATGPAASTPWRMGLIRDLVAKVSHVFERGDMDRDRAVRLVAAERELRLALGDGPEPAAFLASVPPAYALWADPADAPGHLRLVVPRPGASEVRTEVRPARTPGTFALTVSAVDRPGLLARVAGALTLSGLSVLQAQAFTTDDGVALDAFEVGPAFNEEIGEERWRRFRTSVRHAIEGRVDIRDRIERLREHYRPVQAGIPVTVRVNHRASDFFTVVEVGAADRLGLLFDLARTFSAEGLDVHLAKVATYGLRVVDVFYVTDATGQKLADGNRTAELEAALAAAAS
jgi:[protein-PII] uridylyltransferase